MLERAGHVVVEEAATDVIALEQALGNDDAWRDPGFIDKIVTLQQRRLALVSGSAFFDRSPVCTLALSRHLGFAPSPVLLAEIDRIAGTSVYASAVFFIRNQGFVEATAARRISFAESLEFERLHEQTYRELGFQLVDVAAGPLADRVAVITAQTGTQH
jgi:predicted ATPase